MLSAYLKTIETTDPEIAFAIKKAKLANPELLILLTNLNYEFSKIIPATSEPEVASIRYHWWFEQINDILLGKAPTNNQPLLSALYKTNQKFQLKAKDFSPILKSRDLDLSKQEFKNFQELEKYIDGYLGQIFKLALADLTKSDEQLIKHLSYILKISRIILSLQKHSYNNHPFITSEISNKLKKIPAPNRQDSCFKILKTYLEEQLELAQNIKSKNKFLNCLRKNLDLQSKKILKAKNLDNVELLNYKYLALRAIF